MQTKTFLIILLLALCSAGSKMHPRKSLFTKPTANTKTVVLVYTGGLSNQQYTMGIGVHIEMDTSIGFRYDVTFENGTSVRSHVAFFYRFSSPYQLIEYNYLTHKSSVIKPSASDPGSNVIVVGTEAIDSFSCTHLRQTLKTESDDYWMSASVPGFVQLTQILNQIDPGLMAPMNGTIFQWGGLVRAKMVSTDAKGQVVLDLLLFKAQTGVRFSTKEFDVPSK